MILKFGDDILGWSSDPMPGYTYASPTYNTMMRDSYLQNSRAVLCIISNELADEIHLSDTSLRPPFQYGFGYNPSNGQLYYVGDDDFWWVVGPYEYGELHPDYIVDYFTGNAYNLGTSYIDDQLTDAVKSGPFPCCVSYAWYSPQDAMVLFGLPYYAGARLVAHNGDDRNPDWQEYAAYNMKPDMYSTICSVFALNSSGSISYPSGALQMVTYNSSRIFVIDSNVKITRSGSSDFVVGGYSAPDFLTVPV